MTPTHPAQTVRAQGRLRLDEFPHCPACGEPQIETECDHCGERFPQPQRPMLYRGDLSDRIYVAVEYEDLGEGRFRAVRKFDVTDQVAALRAKELASAISLLERTATYLAESQSLADRDIARRIESQTAVLTSGAEGEAPNPDPVAEQERPDPGLREAPETSQSTDSHANEGVPLAGSDEWMVWLCESCGRPAAVKGEAGVCLDHRPGTSLIPVVPAALLTEAEERGDYWEWRTRKAEAQRQEQTEQLERPDPERVVVRLTREQAERAERFIRRGSPQDRYFSPPERLRLAALDLSIADAIALSQTPDGSAQTGGEERPEDG